MLRIINPYEGIDFANAVRVNAISHEHIYEHESESGFLSVHFKEAYDRGIRAFACVDYQPACPSYPLGKFSVNYRDYTSYEDLTMITKNYHGGLRSIVDAVGNTVNTDDVPQLPNAEHPVWCFNKNGGRTFGFHFNVLGNIWGEPGWGVNDMADAQWRRQHVLYDVENDCEHIFTNPDNQLFHGKIFGTVNHPSNIKFITEFLNYAPNVVKAVEIYNNTVSFEKTELYKEECDELFRKGYKFWLVSVVDWQGDFQNEFAVNRGCNQLYMPESYASLPANPFTWNSESEEYSFNPSVYSKAEAILDCYLSGKFAASGYGNHHITNVSVDGRNVTFSVDGTPKRLIGITGKDKITYQNTNTITMFVPKGAKFVRFEAYYYNSGEIDPVDKDFVFSQPIFFEESDSMTEKMLLLL